MIKVIGFNDVLTISFYSVLLLLFSHFANVVTFRLTVAIPIQLNDSSQKKKIVFSVIIDARNSNKLLNNFFSSIVVTVVVLYCLFFQFNFNFHPHKSHTIKHELAIQFMFNRKNDFPSNAGHSSNECNHMVLCSYRFVVLANVVVSYC